MKFTSTIDAIAHRKDCEVNTYWYLGVAAGPESLKDYFQNGALLGQKAALNLWYVDTRPKIYGRFLKIVS